MRNYYERVRQLRKMSKFNIINGAKELERP